MAGGHDQDETASKNVFGADTMWLGTLLCGDHLVRGSGPQRTSYALAFTIIEMIINAILLWECLFGGCRQVVALFAGIVGIDMDDVPNELDAVKAWALLAASYAYTIRVIIWTSFVQHTNTTQAPALVLIFFYHIFLHCSQPVVALLPCADYELSALTLYTGLALSFTGFALELLADLQMMWFKNEKKGKKAAGLIADKRVLDTGLWGLCRHPNYFFNAFGVAGIALLTGWWPYALVWFGIQIFWAYCQSGPAHEAYMARAYGEEWADYQRRVAFLFPMMC